MFKVFPLKTSSSSSSSCSLCSHRHRRVWLSIRTTGLALVSVLLLLVPVRLPMCANSHTTEQLLLFFLDQVHSAAASIPGGETGSSSGSRGCEKLSLILLLAVVVFFLLIPHFSRRLLMHETTTRKTEQHAVHKHTERSVTRRTSGHTHKLIQRGSATTTLSLQLFFCEDTFSHVYSNSNRLLIPSDFSASCCHYFALSSPSLFIASIKQCLTCPSLRPASAMAKGG